MWILLSCVLIYGYPLLSYSIPVSDLLRTSTIPILLKEPYGIAPDSNQQSKTSSHLLYSLPSFLIMILSIWWRCKSITEPYGNSANISSSYEEPTQISSPSSLIHIGIGVPQKRDLLIPQSFAFSSHVLNLFLPTCDGYQLICSFNETNFSLISSTFMK